MLSAAAATIAAGAAAATGSSPKARTSSRTDEDAVAVTAIAAIAASAAMARAVRAANAARASAVAATNAAAISYAAAADVAGAAASDFAFEAVAAANATPRARARADQRLIGWALRDGDGDEAITGKIKSATLLRRNARTLLPGGWLNDEVVNMYAALLNKQHEALRARDALRVIAQGGPRLRPTHVFSSFFWTLLTREVR